MPLLQTVCSWHPPSPLCKSYDLNDNQISGIRWLVLFLPACGTIYVSSISDIGSLIFFGVSGIKIFVPLISFLPRYPLSPASILIFLFVRRSTCSNDASIVCPSYSLGKEMAPSMMPVAERMIDTLLPNSYFLCSLPLLIHCTCSS